MLCAVKTSVAPARRAAGRVASAATTRSATAATKSGCVCHAGAQVTSGARVPSPARPASTSATERSRPASLACGDRSTPTARRPPASAMHADVIDRRLWQDAVPEVEEVAGPPRRLPEDGRGVRPDLADRAEKYRRVEVALDRDVVTEPRPGRVQIDAPVEANHVPARRAHRLE